MIGPCDSSVAETEVFTTLYREWRPVAVAAAYRVLRDLDASEDIAQILFTRLWVSGRWRTIEQSRSYFEVAARHEAVRLQARSRRATELFDVPQPTTDPYMDAWRQEFWQVVHNAHRALPPQCRRVMNLSVCHGWSRHEIAIRLGVNMRAVEKQRSRGLRLLRAWFVDHGGRPAWGVSFSEDGG